MKSVPLICTLPPTWSVPGWIAAAVNTPPCRRVPVQSCAVWRPVIHCHDMGRGHPPADADAGVDFVAFGGTARVAMVEAWEMGTIWQPSPRAAAKAAAAGTANGQEMYERLIAAPPAAVPSVVGVSA